jgi:hypothetical protein
VQLVRLNDTFLFGKKKKKEERERDGDGLTQKGQKLAIELTVVYYGHGRIYTTKACDIRAAPSPLVWTIHVCLSCLPCELCQDGRLVPAMVWLMCVGAKV